MSTLLTAVRLEVESLGRRTTSGTAGTRGRAVGRRATDFYTATLSRIGDTALGSRAGAGTRALTAVLAELPVLTASADAVATMHSIDLLTADVRADPHDHRRRIQLAEAITAADRDRRFLRALNGIAHPASALVSGGMRAGRGLDNDRLAPHLRLARSACRAADHADQDVPDTDLTRARAYRLCGKPGLGLRYGQQAAQHARRDILAARAEPAIMAPSPPHRVTALFGRARRYVTDRSGDYSTLDDELRARKVAGACWTVLALCLRDQGDSAAATAAAGHAVALEFTLGHRLLAELAEPDGSFADRVAERRRTLDRIELVDRVYWAGRHRGGLRTAGATTARQAVKTGRIAARSGSFVAHRLRT